MANAPVVAMSGFSFVVVAVPTTGSSCNPSGPGMSSVPLGGTTGVPPVGASHPKPGWKTRVVAGEAAGIGTTGVPPVAFPVKASTGSVVGVPPPALLPSASSTVGVVTGRTAPVKAKEKNSA